MTDNQLFDDGCNHFVFNVMQELQQLYYDAFIEYDKFHTDFIIVIVINIFNVKQRSVINTSMTSIFVQTEFYAFHVSSCFKDLTQVSCR